MISKKFQAGIAVAVALAVVALFFVFASPFAFFESSPQEPELVVQDERAGTGDAAQAGDILTVNYTGRLEDGTVFDTSYDEEPVSFMLGAGLVIRGWDQGLAGLREGGKRLLIIPASLAYGAEGRGPIPPNATLIFEVELLDVSRSQ